jgi:1-phosphatidylinositol phosphodiesterase
MKADKLLPLVLTLSVLAPFAARADATRSYNRSSTIETSHPNWMRWVPDSQLLSDLSLPGTHDTMALYGGDLVETQSLPLRSQLDAGIRVLDIRCRHIEDVFAIHHGIVFQNAYFGTDVLKVCYEFLQDNPTETILMRLGDAGVPEEKNCTREYEETFEWYRDNTTYGSCIYVNPSGYDTIATLGEVRGKVIILDEFDGGDWGYNFFGDNTDLLDMQAEYDLNTLFDLDDKWDIVRDFFQYTDGDTATWTEWGENGTVHHRPAESGRFYINWTSATSFNGGVYPNAIASYVNPRVLEYLFNRNQTRTAGIVWMDFPGAGLIDAIIAHNFKYATNTALLADDFEYVFNNISYSATEDGSDQCLDHATQLQDFLEFVLPSQYWSVVASATQGGDNWGYALSSEGLLKQSDWIDGYSHVAVNARSLNCPVTDAQLAAFLTTTRLQTLSGTAASRASAARSMVSAQFPGNRWNVVVKRAPGGFGNWAVQYFASANHSSGWITDDGEEYNYVVWATSQFNAAPAANPGGPYVVAEGSAVTFSAAGSTDPEGSTLQYRWDFNGDGIWDTGRGTKPTALTTFPNDPAPTVRLEVFDGLHTNIVTVPITVTNVPPRVSAGGDATVFTNALFTRTGSFIDPGAEASWIVKVDYGDGSRFDIGHSNKAFTLSHVYAAAGNYTVEVGVDDGRVRTTSSFILSVVNPGPPQFLGIDVPTYAVAEGSSVTVTGQFFHASWVPGTTINVNWADGTAVSNVTGSVTSVGAGNWRFIASHTYANNPSTNNDTYIISIGISGIATRTASIKVDNIAPSLDAPGSVTWTEGSVGARLVTFTDPGADAFEVEIDFGDGDFMSFPTTERFFNFSHRYVDAGVYDATITVTDEDGKWDSITFPITVLNVAPNVTAFVTQTNRIFEGGTAFVSGTFTSTARDHDSFIAMIDWGDGRPRTPAYMVNTIANTKSFSASHRYLDNNSSNTFVITAFISDDDGTTNTRSTTITVENTVPRVSAGVDAGIPAGGPLTSYGFLEDRGADTFAGRVDYGDGTGWQALLLANSTFSFNHTFPSNALYKVTVEITDDDGAKGADSIYVVVGPPRLSITRPAPTAVQLSWPVHPAGFHLQRWLTLSSTNVWQNVGNSPTTANGTNYLNLSAPVDQRYWRLIWP